MFVFLAATATGEPISTILREALLGTSPGGILIKKGTKADGEPARELHAPPSRAFGHGHDLAPQPHRARADPAHLPTRPENRTRPPQRHRPPLPERECEPRSARPSLPERECT